MFEGFQSGRFKTSGADLHYVRAGDGPPLLLLHGYPQTHAIWHLTAPRFARSFTVIAPDLRGYGASSKPAAMPDHFSYSKRAMAQDMAELMDGLGFDRFDVVGHDRGGRVAHRLCLDHPGRVRRACFLDIVPTLTWFENITAKSAHDYYHWLFLSQPFDLPERLIGSDPDYYLRHKLGNWTSGFDKFAPEAVEAYLTAFRDPATIHASCEDYRAAATIDLDHDRADRDRKIEQPLLVLWGRKGRMHGQFDMLACWRDKAVDVRGRDLPCGHYIPEEAPDALYDDVMAFMGRS